MYQQLISGALSHGAMFVMQLTGNENSLSGFVQVLFDQMCVHNAVLHLQLTFHFGVLMCYSFLKLANQKFWESL